jgi:hypothetical protein
MEVSWVSSPRTAYRAALPLRFHERVMFLRRAAGTEPGEHDHQDAAHVHRLGVAHSLLALQAGEVQKVGY